MSEAALDRNTYVARRRPAAGALVAPALLLLIFVAAAWSTWVGELPLPSWLGSDLLRILLPVVLLALLAVAVEWLWPASKAGPVRRSLAASGAGIVGGTLLVGAWAKALIPSQFAEQIESEGLDFLLPAAVVALIALALEFGLGTALVLGARSRVVLLSSFALVAFFLFLTGRAYWRDIQGIVVEDASCGCFGNLVERTPAQAFWQDVSLLLPGLLLALLALAPWRRSLGRHIAAAVVLVAGTAFASQSERLPLDDLATQLHPGAAVADICSGRDDTRLCLPTVVPELESGRAVVVLADLEDEVFGSEVERLNAYYLAGEGPQLVVLSAATPEQSQAFFWTYGPSFDVREAPEGLIALMVRRLPRSFLVDDGEVVATYRSMPPLAELSHGSTEAATGVSGL